MILKLQNINVHYPSRKNTIFTNHKIHALKNINLALKKGQTVGIVGESGSGKSTLANVIIGLQQPTSGEIYFNNFDLLRANKAQKQQFARELSVIFQDPSTALNPRMKVRDILKDPMQVHDYKSKEEQNEKVAQLLKKVGLPYSVLNVHPGNLSGGQKQRVAIARALALEPQLIVADEPTSALDVSVRAQILNLLADLKQEMQLSMIFISHDIHTIRQVSDQIAVVFSGEIVEQGSVEQVFENPSQEYTQKLLKAAPSFLI